MAGIYVHFPFCASRCIYCDFYSRVRNDWTAYVEALVKELSANGEFFRGVPPATLYFGGGTPSLLPAGELNKVSDAARNVFGVAQFEEFTLEANPDDVNPSSAQAWRKMGVTRVSMGVQSFDDAHLKWMNRRHTSSQVAEAVKALRSAGIGDVSIDLIFGFTGLSDEQWDDNISKALSLAPEHISCYQMTGRYSHPSEELCFSQYARLQDRLSEAGYQQYEVSNFCLEGHESRHNSGYWNRSAYLGVGAAAHSFDGERFRRWNLADIDKYVGGAAPIEESLTDEECIEEILMLGLRTAAGVDLNLIPEDYREKMKPALNHMTRTGSVSMSGSRIRIPCGKLFISDWIVGQIIV